MATIVVALGELITQKKKTAILTPATAADQYRLGSLWAQVGSGETWQDEQEVEAVIHFHQHEHAVGDRLNIRALETLQIVCEVEILRIRMANCAQLPLDDIQALGYPDRITYVREWGNVLEKHRGWMMDIALIEGAQH